MRAYLSIIALAVGFTATPLLAQQQQRPQPEEFSQLQQPQQNAQVQQQVRDFFQGLQAAITQDIRNGNFEQAAQHFQTNLAKDANCFASNEVYLNNNLIASGVAELNHNNLSQLIGFAASRMQTGRSMSNYDLNIRVQDVSPFPGGQVARVRTAFSEYAGLPGQQAGGGQQQQQQAIQTQQPDQGSSRQTGAELDAQTRCTHIVYLTQGKVQIGDSFCRAQTRILTDGQM
jgi:hypothetical protein